MTAAFTSNSYDTPCKGMGRVRNWSQSKGTGFIEPIDELNCFNGSKIFFRFSALHMNRSVSKYITPKSPELINLRGKFVEFEAVQSYNHNYDYDYAYDDHRKAKWKAIKVTAIGGRYVNASDSVKCARKMISLLYCNDTQDLSIQQIESGAENVVPQIIKRRLYSQHTDKTGKIMITTEGVTLKQLKPNIYQHSRLDLDSLPIDITTNLNINNANNTNDLEDEKVCHICIVLFFVVILQSRICIVSVSVIRITLTLACVLACC